MSTKQANLSGQVVKEFINAGSKSEGNAVMLKADDGINYVLRRSDGPAFNDTELEKLVGKAINATGVSINDEIFIIREWQLRM